jgi:dolichyl-phosphate-mannose-protein mannosyltransferase
MLFCRVQYQSTLKGANNYDPTGHSLVEWRAKEGFWWTMITHNIRMVVHNAAILEPHHWQAAWWEWLLDLRGVAYYGKDTLPGKHAQVYLIGNPAVLWTVLAFMGAAGAYCFIYIRYRSQLTRNSPLHSLFRQLTFCLLVYGINLMPYLGVKRSTFIYHYMPALIYGQIITGRIIDAMVPKKYLATATKAYLLLVLVGWVFMAPWVYALPITGDAHDRRRLMPRWN